MFDRLDDILIRFEELLQGAGRACPSGGDLYSIENKKKH